VSGFLYGAPFPRASTSRTSVSNNDRTKTAPYGHPTHEIEALIRKGVKERVRKIERTRKTNLIVEVLFSMTDAERALTMRRLVNMFGIGEAP
jgi:hypothetical protein